MKTNNLFSLVLSFVLLLAVSIGAVTAQAGGLAVPDGPLAVDATVNSRIGYQGVLKEGGIPVNGTRDMTFRLYSNNTCATQVGSDIVKNDVPVTNGLFNVALDVSPNDFTGDALWLRLVIGGIPLGCQEILPAPYALSLRPGATISGTSPNVLAPVLGLIDDGNGAALFAMSSSEDGVAGEFWQNDADGYAIYAFGKIASSRKTYLWMSGNGLVKWDPDDTTIIEISGDAGMGGARIYPGTGAGTKYVVMPTTIAGTLYGQDVKITGMDVYWQCSNDLMGIANIRLRRTDDANDYTDIMFSNTGWGCEDDVNPNGCTLHLSASSNNVLTADAGILYLVMGLNFAGETTWNRILGIRLTLEYQE